MRPAKRYLERIDRIALRFRRARFRLFERLLSDFQRPVRILDVGGREEFWSNMGLDLSQHHVTVVNLPGDLRPATRPGVTVAAGDARDLREYRRGDFDVVFSNSVIEHVGSWSDQLRMAAEVRRLAGAYFVQTPNYWFLLEPHTYVPGFQFLPLDVRARLIQRFALGYFPRLPDAEEARRLAETTRLLTKRELANLFPDAAIAEEALLGMTKSLVAIRYRTS